MIKKKLLKTFMAKFQGRKSLVMSIYGFPQKEKQNFQAPLLLLTFSTPFSLTNVRIGWTIYTVVWLRIYPVGRDGESE